ncbi:MAG: PIN domain-containing protein [Planctomycetota bacterium]
MRVVIDTPIWSLSLRRARKALARTERGLVHECRDLISAGRVVLLGAVRQEVLSGIPDDVSFERIRTLLALHADEPLDREDYEEAARCSNRFRSRGIAGSPVDCLIVAVASRREAAVFTTDNDFGKYARLVNVRLHAPPENPQH